ncbi:hypothetical protein GNI_165580 [Gregarina niphandrodes]|uniref:Transmembrane protein n=1 Tax=Gregarina niphandrodes TaxID=110365 RepID=A0A023AYQ3_GRENI|nr:hypothetical protein GNI_165580 [Gregarina niphandrodes]EZG43583.1 hypothetical protein GNI_165580 [Gregarina niphandrodes]|eukprot:XP_011133191.1 hypothetical protein GNI_165580 [Gregarina niphandrodes]
MFSSTLILLALATEACHDLLIKPPVEQPWPNDLSRLVAERLLDVLVKNGSAWIRTHDLNTYFTVRTSFVLDFLGMEVIAVCAAHSALVDSPRTDWHLSAVDDVLVIHPAKLPLQDLDTDAALTPDPDLRNALLTQVRRDIPDAEWNSNNKHLVGAANRQSPTQQQATHKPLYTGPDQIPGTSQNPAPPSSNLQRIIRQYFRGLAEH